MTRREPTDSEKAIKEALSDHFADAIEFHDREIEDRPDFLFRVNGRLISCEATQTPPSEILRFNYKRGLYEAERQKAIGVQVVWAVEPHVWISQAIKRKRGRIVEYRKRTGAEKVWLIVHAPIGDKDRYVGSDLDWQIQMMRYGAASTGHGFDSILFWDERLGFTKLHRRGQRCKRPNLDLSTGYPCDSFTLFSSGEICTAEEGADPVEYDFGQIELSRIIIPPFDPEFRKYPPKIAQPTRKGVRAIAYATKIDFSLYDIDRS